MSSSSSSRRTVHFSEMSKLYVISESEDHGDVDKNELWYTDADRLSIRQQIWRSIHGTLQMLDIPQHHAPTMTEEQFCSSLGVEHLLTVDMALAVRNHRRRHTQTVMTNQGTSSPEELRRISRQSSKNTRKRAYNWAMHVFNMFQHDPQV